MDSRLSSKELRAAWAAMKAGAAEYLQQSAPMPAVYAGKQVWPPNRFIRPSEEKAKSERYAAFLSEVAARIYGAPQYPCGWDERDAKV